MNRLPVVGVLFLLAMVFMAGKAAAADPPGDPDASGRDRAYYGPGGYGSSFWSYGDSTESVHRTEGAYREFIRSNGWNADGTPRADSLGSYSATLPTAGDDRDRGPHGGYTTTTGTPPGPPTIILITLTASTRPTAIRWGPAGGFPTARSGNGSSRWP